MFRNILRSLLLQVPQVRRLWEDRERLREDLEDLRAKLSGPSLFPLSETDADRSDEDGALRHFLVTSWGHSGSIWLAVSLNLHEEVFSSVGIDHPLSNLLAYGFAKNAKVWLDGAREDLFAFGVDEFGRQVLNKAGVSIDTKRDVANLHTYVFDELEAITKARSIRALGNVHGLTLHQVCNAHRNNARLLNGRRVVVMDLIRHPVPRTESAINATRKFHLQSLDSWIQSFIDGNARECLDLERKYGVDFSEPRARASLHVFRQGLQNDVWANDVVDYPYIQRVLLERLQNEPEHFASVFWALTHGTLVAEKGYLDKVYSTENLGSGRQSVKEVRRPAGPREQYEQWSPFERSEFARVARRLNLPKVYFRFGYDLSYVTRAPFEAGTWFSDAFPS